MNVTVDQLAKEIVSKILHDIGSMEKTGQVVFSLTSSQKWEKAREWCEQTKQILTKSLVESLPFTAGFDGSAIPNPGTMKIGGWIKNPDGSKLYSFTKEIGQGTNNEAEYHALIKLMEEIVKRGIKKVHIQGDSKLIINQVNGKCRCKNSHLKVLRNQVYVASHGLEYKLVHVVRECNSEADSLTRE